MNDDGLRDQLRDQLAHWPVGSEAVGIDDARDMTDAVLSGPLAPLLRERDTLRAFMLDNQQQFGDWCVDRVLDAS